MVAFFKKSEATKAVTGRKSAWKALVAFLFSYKEDKNLSAKTQGIKVMSNEPGAMS